MPPRRPLPRSQISEDADSCARARWLNWRWTKIRLFRGRVICLMLTLMIGSTPLTANAMVFALCGPLLAFVLFMTLQWFVRKLLVAKLGSGKRELVWWKLSLSSNSPDTRWAARRQPSPRPGYVKRCSSRFPHGNWGTWQSDRAGCTTRERKEAEKRRYIISLLFIYRIRL